MQTAPEISGTEFLGGGSNPQIRPHSDDHGIFSKRPLGIEIEAVGINPFRAQSVLQRLGLPVLQRTGFAQSPSFGASRFEYWQIMSDKSLRPDPGMADDATFEVATPILSTAKDFATLAPAMEALKNAGARVNESCALHVHVDLREIWQNAALRLRAMKNIVLLFLAFPQAINSLVGRRDHSNVYARPLRAYFRDQGFFDPAPDTIEKIVYSLTIVEFQRFFSVAGKNPQVKFCCGEYRTAEFRDHQGTLDPDKALAWAALCQAMTDYAVKTAMSGNLIQIKSCIEDSLNGLLRLLDKAQLHDVLRPPANISTQPLGNTAHPAARSGRPWSGLVRCGR